MNKKRKIIKCTQTQIDEVANYMGSYLNNSEYHTIMGCKIATSGKIGDNEFSEPTLSNDVDDVLTLNRFQFEKHVHFCINYGTNHENLNNIELWKSMEQECCSWEL